MEKENESKKTSYGVKYILNENIHSVPAEQTQFRAALLTEILF